MSTDRNVPLREIADSTKRESAPPALVGMLLVVPLAFLVAPHLLFDIPMRSLLGLCLSVSAATLLLGPLFYIANKRGRANGNWKPACAVAGVAGGVVACLTLYYGAKLGVLSSEVSRGSMIAILIALPPAMVGAYYLDIKLFPKHFGRGGDSGK